MLNKVKCEVRNVVESRYEQTSLEYFNFLKRIQTDFFLVSMTDANGGCGDKTKIKTTNKQKIVNKSINE